jgi:hypothetical protein
MAVLIDGCSVIVRNSTLEARYPGGLEGYRDDCPNRTFCADESLCRVGFMVQRDAELFVAELATKGLTPFRKEVAEDVALVSPEGGLVRPCSWLEIGRWGKATIAWLTGKKPGDLHAPANWNAGSATQWISTEEAKQHLEFVRADGAVDVYRDRRTGQEYYVGVGKTTEEDRVRHNELYQRACDLTKGLLILGNQETAPLEASERQRLEEAIRLFIEVVAIKPDNWAAMWLLGKILQRLGEYGQGLEWFARAHRINPDQPDVAREAAIAAMDLGRPEEAIPYCEAAIAAKSDDPGLRANLALALLFSEKPAEARAIGQEAMARDPADAITVQLVRIIEEVLSGERPCPHHIRDLQ